ncbi:16S rRNA processing protein RimM [Pedobacter yulinensis]|uniref:Ribosome maturation factor RimM n=1 Tax=Pedobacter yulinensis TaxID=2126353 RepID=A0A2T3HRG0_9SPHI|nr:ribosome maturation factor RimM [Pedobacter yulinensis]PST85032.1 16S rRNA processing protein RimM [Pedobacter yulinensis]
MKHEEAFYVGYITKTRGLKGELQVFFEADRYDQLDPQVFFFDMSGKLVPYFVASLKIHANSTGYLLLDDVDHIDKAQPLVRKKVYLPLAEKPVAGEDDFAFTDLKGFTVTDRRLGLLGQITDVHVYPQQFVAALLYREKEVLFPLNEDFIMAIDQQAGSVETDLPEGLLEVYLEG